jgi:hypothetical protein
MEKLPNYHFSWIVSSQKQISGGTVLEETVDLSSDRLLMMMMMMIDINGIFHITP